MDRSELGKLLFEKRGGGALFAGGVIAIVVGCIELLSFIAVDELGLKIFAFIAGPAMIAVGIFGIRLARKKLCVYERGISDGNVAVPFEQISSYSFNVQNMGTAGIHTETLVTFWFVPKFPAGRLQFRFAFQEKRNIDPAIDVAHNHITASLAELMLNELRARRPVVWTKSLTLRPEGLEYSGAGGAIKIARYADITEPTAESLLVINNVRLTARDIDSPLATLTPDELNFYPGMLALETMCAAAKGVQ